MESPKDNRPAESPGGPAPVANGNVAGGDGKGAPAPALPASATPKSPALFGGYRGGKKTYSGFPADSPEHAEWLRKREAERSARRREEAKALRPAPPLPPASPAAVRVPVDFAPAPSPAGASPAPADSGAGVPIPSAGAAVAVAGAVAVPWTTRMLQKPAALVTRIVDRFRKRALNRRLDRLSGILTPDELREVKKDLEWEDKAVADFNDALAEVSALGLNEAGIDSKYSPFVNLTLAAGELGNAHLSALDRLEKLLAMRLAAQKEKTEETPKAA